MTTTTRCVDCNAREDGGETGNGSRNNNDATHRNRGFKTCTTCKRVTCAKCTPMCSQCRTRPTCVRCFQLFAMVYYACDCASSVSKGSKGSSKQHQELLLLKCPRCMHSSKCVNCKGNGCGFLCPSLSCTQERNAQACSSCHTSELCSDCRLYDAKYCKECKLLYQCEACPPNRRKFRSIIPWFLLPSLEDTLKRRALLDSTCDACLCKQYKDKFILQSGRRRRYQEPRKGGGESLYHVQVNVNVSPPLLAIDADIGLCGVVEAGCTINKE